MAFTTRQLWCPQQIYRAHTVGQRSHVHTCSAVVDICPRDQLRDLRHFLISHLLHATGALFLAGWSAALVEFPPVIKSRPQIVSKLSTSIPQFFLLRIITQSNLNAAKTGCFNHAGVFHCKQECQGRCQSGNFLSCRAVLIDSFRSGCRELPTGNSIAASYHAVSISCGDSGKLRQSNPVLAHSCQTQGSGSLGETLAKNRA